MYEGNLGHQELFITKGHTNTKTRGGHVPNSAASASASGAATASGAAGAAGAGARFEFDRFVLDRSAVPLFLKAIASEIFRCG